MAVTIGPKDGAGNLPNGMIIGKKLIPMVKGKHLFVKMTLKHSLGPE